MWICPSIWKYSLSWWGVNLSAAHTRGDNCCLMIIQSKLANVVCQRPQREIFEKCKTVREEEREWWSYLLCIILTHLIQFFMAGEREYLCNAGRTSSDPGTVYGHFIFSIPTVCLSVCLGFVCFVLLVQFNNGFLWQSHPSWVSFCNTNCYTNYVWSKKNIYSYFQQLVICEQSLNPQSCD